MEWQEGKRIAEKVSKVLDFPGLDLIPVVKWVHLAIDLIVALIPDAIPGEEKHLLVVARLVEEGAPASTAGFVTKAAYLVTKRERPDLFPGFVGNADPESERP